jgi:cyclophilin family peptidyl-prolyl cis-trans isomerase
VIAQPSAETPSGATDNLPAGTKPIVAIVTSVGTIKAELWPDKSPISADNFLKYVKSGHYDGTIFHRCIRGFMIQCGEFPQGTAGKGDREPIKNEAANGLKNLRGTLAMARTGEVNSATSQFFINVTDNAALDHKNDTVKGFGYCVFGKVIEGMDVVDKIKGVATRQVPQMGPEPAVPVEPVLIKSVTRAPAATTQPAAVPATPPATTQPVANG